MKRLLFAALLTVGLLGCQKDSDSPSGFGGRWKLVERQCYCNQNVLPNETLTLTASRFEFYENGQLVSKGTYDEGAGRICGGEEGLVTRFRYESANAPALDNARMSLTDDTLVLDFGAPCDAPRKTYKRIVSK